MCQNNGVRHIEHIEEHESILRRMVSEAHGTPYCPLRSVDEAKAASDGVVVLEGDWGGQIYAVFPASLMRCGEDVLQQLLKDLDAIAWPCNEGEGAGVFYERLPSGAVVSGGMGGGIVVDGVWVHKEFRRLGLTTAIREVIAGSRLRMIPRWHRWAGLRLRVWLGGGRRVRNPRRKRR
jgi:hypothetical protein